MSSIFPLFQYSSWATTIVLISDVWVLFFKVLYLSSATAGAQAGISLCICIEVMHEYCCWDFLPSKKYCHCTLPKQHVPTSNSVTLQYDHMTGLVT
jgi:hypothetical protein